MRLRTITAFILATLSLVAQAADSVDVKVIGTIVPAACTPVLSGGGTVDYGTIPASSLSATAYTVLTEKEVDFTITCEAPAKIAIKALNGRPNSTAGTLEGPTGFAMSDPSLRLFNMAPPVMVAGLGLDGSDRIGAYGLRIVPGTTVADGSAADTIITAFSSGYNGSWNTSSGLMFPVTFTQYLSWAAKGSYAPLAFTTLAGKLGVQAYINKASELNLSKPIYIDGLTTLEVTYL